MHLKCTPTNAGKKDVASERSVLHFCDRSSEHKNAKALKAIACSSHPLGLRGNGYAPQLGCRKEKQENIKVVSYQGGKEACKPGLPRAHRNENGSHKPNPERKQHTSIDFATLHRSGRNILLAAPKVSSDTQRKISKPASST